MANKDDQTTDEDVVDSTDEVDEETQDETSVEDTTSDDDGEETDDEADDSDSDEESDEPEQFERRFTQFKADDPATYAKQLEDAYAKSTQEGQRLYQEVETLKDEVMNLTANRKPGDSEDDTDNTEQSVAERIVMSEYRKRSREAYDTFVEKHPELKEDTVLAQRLQKKVGIAARVAMEEDNEMLDMDEALRIGWAALGYSDDSGSNTDDEAQKIKEQTSVSKTTNKKKKTKKSDYTPEQLAVARRTYRDKSDKELVELLDKHKS